MFEQPQFKPEEKKPESLREKVVKAIRGKTPEELHEQALDTMAELRYGAKPKLTPEEQAKHEEHLKRKKLLENKE